MHDVNGTELRVGDKVMIECEIVEVQAHEEFCNATVRPRPMRGRAPGENYDDMVVNTGQLLLLARAPVEPAVEAQSAPEAAG